MSLSIAEVEYVSRLARMKLSPDELERMREQLSSILEYIDLLQEVDVSGVEPTAQITGLTTVLRPDEVEPSLTQAELERNAPAFQQGMFRVKPVFE